MTLARKVQLPEDDLRTETCRSNFSVLMPFNAELNPICHLLTLIGARHILNISRIRVNVKILYMCISWYTN